MPAEITGAIKGLSHWESQRIQEAQVVEKGGGTMNLSDQHSDFLSTDFCSLLKLELSKCCVGRDAETSVIMSNIILLQLLYTHNLIKHARNLGYTHIELSIISKPSKEYV